MIANTPNIPFVTGGAIKTLPAFPGNYRADDVIRSHEESGRVWPLPGQAWIVRYRPACIGRHTEISGQQPPTPERGWFGTEGVCVWGSRRSRGLSGKGHPGCKPAPAKLPRRPVLFPRRPRPSPHGQPLGQQTPPRPEPLRQTEAHSVDSDGGAERLQRPRIACSSGWTAWQAGAWTWSASPRPLVPAAPRHPRNTPTKRHGAGRAPLHGQCHRGHAPPLQNPTMPTHLCMPSHSTAAASNSWCRAHAERGQPVPWHRQGRQWFPPSPPWREPPRAQRKQCRTAVHGTAHLILPGKNLSMSQACRAATKPRTQRAGAAMCACMAPSAAHHFGGAGGCLERSIAAITGKISVCTTLAGVRRSISK